MSKFFLKKETKNVLFSKITLNILIQKKNIFFLYYNDSYPYLFYFFFSFFFFSCIKLTSSTTIGLRAFLFKIKLYPFFFLSFFYIFKLYLRTEKSSRHKKKKKLNELIKSS